MPSGSSVGSIHHEPTIVNAGFESHAERIL